MKRRPSRRSADHTSRAKQGRQLGLEPLEDRRLMASDVVKGLGVIGESYSDEFTLAEVAAGYANWVALLDGRGADAGGDGTTVHGVTEPPNDPSYDPRGTGYAYNWSIDRGSYFDLSLEGGMSQLSLQIEQSAVSHAVVMFGMHEFTDIPGLSDRRFPPNPPNQPQFTWYDNLYNNDGTVDIDAVKFPLLLNMSIFVENLSRAGANVVLATIPDPSDLPGYAQNAAYSNPAFRDRVTAAIQNVNADIRAMGLEYRVPVVDLYQLQKDLLGTAGGAANRLAARTIGGASFTTGTGAASASLFKDGIHPGTAMHAVIANSVMTALNQGYGTNLQLFSEQEIVTRVGRTFTGNSLNLNYSSYVQVPGETVVVFDFGSTGDPQNDFGGRLAELWATIGTTGALTPAEVNQLKADVHAQVQAAFSGSAIGANNLRLVDYSNLPSDVNLNGGNFHRISFGLETVTGSGRNVVIGNFEQDWRNTDFNGVGFIAPEELSGVLTNLTGMDRAARLQYIRNAISFYTVQGIGFSLGLSHADAFARPQVTPATYANTNGVQNADYMSGQEALGFSIATLKNNVAFGFSPIAKAKLQMAIGVYDSRLAVGVEAAAAHGTTGTAQPVTLQAIAGSTVKASGIGRANITAAGQKDVYSVQVDAGQLITVQTLLAGDAAGSPNTVIRLLDSSGIEIAQSDDTRLGFNSVVPTGGVLQTTLSLVLNFPAPAAGTYYIEVSGRDNTVGEYDLFVTTMSPNASGSAWTNPSDPLNVDNEPGIVPLDALIVINELNSPKYSNPDGLLRPPPTGNPPPYYDVDGDGYVTALDALIVINYLNRNPSFGSGEGEASLAASESDAAAQGEAFDDISSAPWFWISDFEDGDSED